MVRRGSHKKLQKLGDILQLVLKKQKIPVFFEDQTLRRIWNEAVGPQISAQTAPVHVKRGALYVKVATSVWMHQLQFLKEEIIQKFNQISGRDPISAIHFSLGEVPSTPKSTDTETYGPIPLGPLKPRDQRIIKESLEAIADTELKEILERVMRKEIGRRRFIEKKRGR
ncbi:MAG: DUF721 domain-containing protein [Syntrophales bacterium]|nr:DUF721 domain-containing protein [Syntrophales bacterium]